MVRGRARRLQLARAAYGQGFLAQAPVVIAVCAVPEESARIYGERGRELYCLQDTAAAAENLLLAAVEAGLGACWVGAFDEAGVARVLGLAAGWRPVALLALGHPAELEPPRSRRRMDEVVLWLDWSSGCASQGSESATTYEFRAPPGFHVLHCGNAVMRNVTPGYASVRSAPRRETRRRPS